MMSIRESLIAAVAVVRTLLQNVPAITALKSKKKEVG
jgi:hypothetical protein